jgi:hypothetical protein
MSGRRPYRLPVDLHRGRSGWQRRLREAVEDGLDFDGDNAVLDAFGEIVTEMKIRRRRGRPPEDQTETKIKALAAAVSRDGNVIKQYLLADELGVTESEVSKWLRDKRFTDELASLMAARIGEEKLT